MYVVGYFCVVKCVLYFLCIVFPVCFSVVGVRELVLLPSKGGAGVVLYFDWEVVRV